MLNDLLNELKIYRIRISNEPDKQDILAIQYNRRLYAIYEYIRKLDENTFYNIFNEYFEPIDFKKLNNFLNKENIKSIYFYIQNLPSKKYYEFFDNYYRIKLE